jgi:hypothetical protein
MEFSALSELGAYANMREGLNTASSRRKDAGTLAARLAAGPVEPADPPTPMFAELTARLQMAGIQVSLEGEDLVFGFESASDCGSEEDTASSSPCLRDESHLAEIKLARPMSHPWLRERPLTHKDRLV